MKTSSYNHSIWIVTCLTQLMEIIRNGVLQNTKFFRSALFVLKLRLKSHRRWAPSIQNHVTSRLYNSNIVSLDILSSESINGQSFQFFFLLGAMAHSNGLLVNLLVVNKNNRITASVPFAHQISPHNYLPTQWTRSCDWHVLAAFQKFIGQTSQVTHQKALRIHAGWFRWFFITQTAKANVTNRDSLVARN